MEKARMDTGVGEFIKWESKKFRECTPETFKFSPQVGYLSSSVVKFSPQVEGNRIYWAESGKGLYGSAEKAYPLTFPGRLK